MDNTTDNTTTADSTTTADTTAPSSPTISINSGAAQTISASVTLTLSASDDTGVTAYFLSESSTTPTASSSWISVSSTPSYSSSNIAFTLSSGYVTKTVNVWFQDVAGNISSVVSDSIAYAEPAFLAADSDGMVKLAGGTFTMGDIQGGGGSDESPSHSVTLSSFYISEDEVTAAEYAACTSCAAQLGTTPYSTLGDTTGKAANYVSWSDFTSYISWKNTNSTRSFRMCTEAEWEFAARAGTDTKWACGNTEACLTDTNPDMAWFATNSGWSSAKSEALKVIKTTTANAWGLYDMHGNASEWVSDNYSSSTYTTDAAGVTDPTGATTGTYRVVRSGGFGSVATDLRSANRTFNTSSNRVNSIGLRLCSSN